MIPGCQKRFRMTPTSSKVGGDMNAYSGFDPQDHDGNPTTPEAGIFEPRVLAYCPK